MPPPSIFYTHPIVLKNIVFNRKRIFMREALVLVCLLYSAFVKSVVEHRLEREYNNKKAFKKKKLTFIFQVHIYYSIFHPCCVTLR